MKLVSPSLTMILLSLSVRIVHANASMPGSKNKPLTYRNNAWTCDLVTYRGTTFRQSALIHPEFRSSMVRINSFASNCKIKLYITSSFRKSGQKVGGAIVKPAKRGNHFVGHAIDFNAIDGGKFCNSKCLPSPPAGLSGVKCFIDKIRGDSTLRWGGDFRVKDPVHIDDGLNLRNRVKYDMLYNALQKSSCKWRH